MAMDDYLDEVTRLWEEEGLFARDVQGQLIRVRPATAREYDELVTVLVDDREVRVPRAVPLTDAQGDLINDADGRTIPRRTTILDAVQQLYRSENPAAALPIPTLCHADHMRPVGVCRVCSVAVARREPDPRNPGKMREIAGEKLVPACVQPVEPNMVVHTMHSSSTSRASSVRSAVKVLLEMLVADHLPDGRIPTAGEARFGSDLERLASRLAPQLELNSQRFQSRQPIRYEPDISSQLMAVDHNACILCDRCSRSCNEVKQNFVIGRSGKGYSTRIAFDLDAPMGMSSCVSCGECMLSCPTQALTFRKPVESDWWREALRHPGKSAVAPEELDDHPLLGCLPFRFRQWNQSAIVRWRIAAGEELCRLGEYGTTAFLLNAGSFEIFPQDPRSGARDGGGSWLRRLWRWSRAGDEPIAGSPAFVATPDDVVLGEMTCMNYFPRVATIRARTDGEVLEVRRNVLFALQRNPQAREMLERVYRERSLRRHLDSVEFFSGLTDAEKDSCREFLRERIQLLRADPGQIIFRQGERADGFYMIRHGYVKFIQTQAGQERVLNYFGPNRHFGEIGLLSDAPDLAAMLPASIQERRTATCAALDDVELVRVDRATFQELLRRFSVLRDRFRSAALEMLERQDHLESSIVRGRHLGPFTDAGLFNAQRLLVLDLEACTRCDECAKACADTHQGVTRLIRDGQRFDKWLVASACRSCSDPYCLVGCPVDAIHRHGERMEIVIENHCIGCGLCANHCPYGNINMHGVQETRPDPLNPHRTVAVIQQRASTCDLCRNVVGPNQDVSCVFACPHNAAFRMSGADLLQRVLDSDG
jgi:Fe-S-cluster-containing dehydrogenase component/CRP-like cAMP-binding protein